MKVAIVEDEAITAMFIEQCLLDAEHIVAGMFENAQSLFEFLDTNHSLDLIFMDIKINGDKDGIESACEIKSLYPHIQIIFLTSFRDSQTIQSAKAAKPIGYLIKPILESELEAVLMVTESTLQNSSQDKEAETFRINVAGYKYNPQLKEVYQNGVCIPLSFNEVVCFEYLLENKNSYVSQDKLIAIIWNGEKNRLASLRELIYRLRRKLPNLQIKSAAKIGYILNDGA